MAKQIVRYTSGRSAVRSRGAVLVFVSVILSVLLMFAAMAIDVNLLLVSKEQTQHYTRYVALSAIEAYYAADCPANTPEAECYGIRLEKARSRAAEFAAEYKMLGNRSMQVEIGDDDGNTAINSVKSFLEAGRWIPKDAVDKDICTGLGGAPCFAPVGQGNYKVNSFKVTTTYPMHDVVKFSRLVFRFYNSNLSVRATSSVTPRRACFLVDTSPSITRETHLGKGSTASEYALYLKEDNDPNVSTFHDSLWTGYQTPDVHHHGLENTQRQNENDPTLHFGDDYVRKATLSDLAWGDNPDYALYHPDPNSNSIYRSGERGAGGQIKPWWYRVDVHSDSGYGGPEPLRSVFHGIRGVIETFQERKVSGDKACLIFYDDTLPWPRVVKLTDDFQYLLDLTDFDDMQGGIGSDPVTIDPTRLASDNGRERTIRHMLFPLVDSFTDSMMAFSEAFYQLSEGAETGILTSDFIVHIGDGLVNCPRCSYDPSRPCCGDGYSEYKQAMAELKALVFDKARQKGIPVHTLLIGKEVGPHTVDVADPNVPNSCLSEADLRALGLTDGRVLVPPGGDSEEAFNNKSDVPFYQVNKDMYSIALDTKGIWGPIRPIRPGSSKDSCNEPACLLSPVPERRLFDPSCRDTASQIQDYMQEIMAQNPYIVVDVD